MTNCPLMWLNSLRIWRSYLIFRDLVAAEFFFLLEKNDAEMDYEPRWVCVCSISVINLAAIRRQPAIFRVKREVLDTDQRPPASLILLEIPKLVIQSWNSTCIRYLWVISVTVLKTEKYITNKKLLCFSKPVLCEWETFLPFNWSEWHRLQKTFDLCQKQSAN